MQVLRHLLRLKRNLGDHLGSSHLFFCVADVSSAFDALNREQAFNVAKSLLSRSHYFLWR